MAADGVEIEIGGRTVRISNPGRVYFPARGETKLDLARYYLSVGDGIVRALRERPCMLHRFPGGVDSKKVHQKRVPSGAPPWLETVRATFPRYGRHADELCVTELAHVIWAVQMSPVEFHPWNSRRAADDATTTWWRTDRAPTKVFVDYNQNARDHTIASAYSVRGVSEGTVSAPIRWDEIDDVGPAELTIATVPARFSSVGDLHAGI